MCLLKVLVEGDKCHCVELQKPSTSAWLSMYLRAVCPCVCLCTRLPLCVSVHIYICVSPCVFIHVCLHA